MPGFWTTVANFVRSEIPRTPEPAPIESPFADENEECDCSGAFAWSEWDELGNRLTPAQIVARMLAMVGRGRYKLGKGGRRQRNRAGFGWVSTTSIYTDATGAQTLWRRVRLEDVQAGDGLVYPSTYRAGVRTGIGHCGRAVKVTAPTWAGIDVVDCAARKGAAFGHRTGDLWGKRGGIVVRRV